MIGTFASKTMRSATAGLPGRLSLNGSNLRLEAGLNDLDQSRSRLFPALAVLGPAFMPGSRRQPTLRLSLVHEASRCVLAFAARDITSPTKSDFVAKPGKPGSKTTLKDSASAYRVQLVKHRGRERCRDVAIRAAWYSAVHARR